jgi:outer membrane receptor protein involved in Fe transport
VITRDDIRRTGATSLPEVLRLAPGLQVARIDARSWAITARGFNSRFANKLQVLVDGRSIYTPHVDSLRTYDVLSYTSVDMRAGWHVQDNLELSLTINNALDDDHVEFFDETGGAMGARIGRSFFGRFVWHLGR